MERTSGHAGGIRLLGQSVMVDVALDGFCDHVNERGDRWVHHLDRLRRLPLLRLPLLLPLPWGLPWSVWLLWLVSSSQPP